MAMERMTLTYKEIAQLMGLSLPTLRKQVHKLDVPHIHYGRRVLFPKAAFLHWIDTQSQLPSHGCEIVFPSRVMRKYKAREDQNV